MSMAAKREAVFSLLFQSRKEIGPGGGYRLKHFGRAVFSRPSSDSFILAALLTRHNPEDTDVDDKDLDIDNTLADRRQVLKAVGGSAVLVSVAGLAACGGDAPDPAEPTREPASAPEAAADAMEAAEDAVTGAMDAAEETVGEVMDAAEETMDDAVDAAQDAMDDGMGAAEDAVQSAQDMAADAGGLQRLDQSDPQAQALAYVNDAATVDTAAQPRFEAGQACANCTLFLGEDGAEWGPCSIFPGKLVNAKGWCSVYAPKA